MAARNYAFGRVIAIEQLPLPVDLQVLSAASAGGSELTGHCTGW